MNAAVIGGGISGLLATFELAKKGVQVKLFNAGNHGGVIKSERKDGFFLEHGPNVLINREELFTIIKELNLENEIVYPAIVPYDQFIYFKNRPCKVPRGPFSFLLSPLIDSDQKSKLFKKFISGTFQDVFDLKDLSVRDFFLPLLGKTGTDILLEGALRGIYGGNIQNLSTRFIFPSLWEHAVLKLPIRKVEKGKRPSIITLKNGISSLTDALREKVTGKASISSNKVKEVKRVGSKFALQTENSDEAFDTIYIATCGPESAQYLNSLDLSLVSLLNKIEFVHISVVHVAIPFTSLPKWLKRSFGILFPEEKDLLGIMTNSILFPHVSPDKKALLTLMFSNSENIERKTSDVLFRYLKIRDGKILSITDWPRALPRYAIGHSELVSSINEYEKKFPGLFFLGRDVGKPSISERVKFISSKLS